MRTEDVCAIIVTHNPDQEIEEQFKRVANQVGKIVVVDNCSNKERKIMLSQVCATLSIGLFDNKQNKGIATALNQGIVWAQEHRFRWVITFDQDTLIEKDLIDRLVHCYIEIEKTEKIAMIGTRYKESYHTSAIDSQASTGISETKTIITSGSLFSIDLFNNTGMFRDELFIDCVDHEFCLRCRKLGYKTFLLNEYLMEHSIGKIIVRNFFGKQVVTTNHSALRRYYMMRNSIIIFKEYFSFDPHWVTYNLFLNFKYIFIILLFESHKLQKLKYITIGIVDGIFSNYRKYIS